MPKPDPVAAGLTAEEAQRLKRILKEPRDIAASPLHGDSVRVVAIADELSGTRPASDARLDTSILAVIQDNTFGITAAEKLAYDTVLAKVGDVPLENLRQIALDVVPFAALMLDTNRYRGEVLTIEGDLRRIDKLPARSGETTTGESFEAWLFTADSGTNPYRVVLASLPDGIPRTGNLNPPVRAQVTGYYFKRYSYATSAGFHTAPLLIAKMWPSAALAKSHGVRSAADRRGLTFLAIGLFAAFVILCVVMNFFVRRRSRHRRVSNAAPESPPDLSWLKPDSHEPT